MLTKIFDCTALLPAAHTVVIALRSTSLQTHMYVWYDRTLRFFKYIYIYYLSIVCHWCFCSWHGHLNLWLLKMHEHACMQSIDTGCKIFSSCTVLILYELAFKRCKWDTNQSVRLETSIGEPVLCFELPIRQLTECQPWSKRWMLLVTAVQAASDCWKCLCG